MAVLIFVSDQEWHSLRSQLSALVTKVTLLQASSNRIEAAMSAMEVQLGTLDQDFDLLEAQATANTNAEQAAVTLLGQLAGMIQNSLSDPTRVSALAARLKTTADALGAAIVADTPAQGQSSQPPA